VFLLLLAVFAWTLFSALRKDLTISLVSIEGRCALVSDGARDPPSLMCAARGHRTYSFSRCLEERWSLGTCSRAERDRALWLSEADLFVRIENADGTQCSFDATRLPPRSAFALGRPLDLERASEEELRMLPGIGRSRARAIVEFRKASGGIGNLKQLEKVRGIGGKTLERLRGLATCGNPK